MLKMKTVLQQVAIPNARNVIGDFVRVVLDNGAVIERSATAHTVNVLPDTDLAALLVAVNNDITTRTDMRWPSIEQDEWARLVAYCEVTHTPEVKAAWAEYRAAERAKQTEIVTIRRAELQEKLAAKPNDAGLTAEFLVVEKFLQGDTP